MRMPLAETSPFAPVGELLIVDGGERVVCHLCGRALRMLGATHLRQHGWTADLYREAFGLRRGASLCAPVMTERRRPSNSQDLWIGVSRGLLLTS